MDSINQTDMKEKIRKLYLTIRRKLHESKLCGKNLIKSINKGCPRCKIRCTILKMNRGVTNTNKPKDYEIEDYTYELDIIYPE